MVEVTIVFSLLWFSLWPWLFVTCFQTIGIVRMRSKLFLFLFLFLGTDTEQTLKHVNNLWYYKDLSNRRLEDGEMFYQPATKPNLKCGLQTVNKQGPNRNRQTPLCDGVLRQMVKRQNPTVGSEHWQEPHSRILMFDRFSQHSITWWHLPISIWTLFVHSLQSALQVGFCCWLIEHFLSFNLLLLRSL